MNSTAAAARRRSAAMSSSPSLSPEAFRRGWRRPREAAAEWAARWARRRQGADPVPVRLASRRIYILPTGVGVTYGLMTFAMLLGSMNYNNSMGFALTFVLAALGWWPCTIAIATWP